MTKRPLTIAGISLEAPAPYAEGHTLKANEAAVLNQTYAENIRNNFANNVKAAIEAAGGGENVNVADLQAKLDEYVASYEFGVRRSGGSVVRLDPREKIARDLARTKVKAAIAKKGIALSSVPKDQIEDYVIKILETQGDDFYKEADRQLKVQQKVASDTLDLSDLLG